MLANPGKRIIFFEMAGIFATAYNKSATIKKAVNGFLGCGLWPFNDQIFDQEDFIAAGVTEESNPAEVLEVDVTRNLEYKLEYKLGLLLDLR